MREQFKVLDIFAGAGGFSLGFKMAGGTVVGGIEIDKWAGETLAYNHPDSQIVIRDIQTISDEEAIRIFKSNKPNIIIGGPPCQGFSVCRQGTGDAKDPRNTLFQEFIRFGRIFEPDLMIMENVPNLVKIKTQNEQAVIEIIKKELIDLGYHVDYSILNATDYGIPQIRRRLFIVASKVKITHPFPPPTHTIASQTQLSFWEHSLLSCPTLWDAISDLPNLEAGEGAEEMSYSKPPQTDYQKRLRVNCKLLYNHKAMNHTKRMVERFTSMSWGDSCSNVPYHLRPRRRNSEKIADHIYDQNNRRLHPSRPCHTLPANRNFTAREGARIQSFPDHYVFMGKPTVVSHKLLAREGRENEKFLCQYNQIGNAVPPLLAKQIAHHLFQQLSNSKDDFKKAV
ncbi:DNA (cytosine-5-)-methyltransferase family protein [Lyngbya aestuarii BL J]|uniref:Cytosine-specific methyltransferase n=1 Tax=Lyngbya aestuarii BL J TaxID=1348334 RepID=U7QLT9_9CYAN|nr:DNA cytosine methyltransferase [Lyngbya aestuarii]ERT08075.1 DNA (cytosine-5-)-methyltransferase family protein [Lyngbya aestuarii BL J]